MAHPNAAPLGSKSFHGHGHSWLTDNLFPVAHARAPRGHVVTRSGRLQRGVIGQCEPHFRLGSGHVQETISFIDDSTLMLPMLLRPPSEFQHYIIYTYIYSIYKRHTHRVDSQ